MRLLAGGRQALLLLSFALVSLSAVLVKGAEDDAAAAPANSSQQDEAGATANDPPAQEEGREKDEVGGKVCNNPANESPNLLFIVLDQLRFDAVGYAQQNLPDFASKSKVRTPNIDELARNGAAFETGT